MRVLHVTPYMHPSAGGPPVVVENFIREIKKYGHDSEIVSTAMFCNGDEGLLLEKLNTLTPTTFLARSRSFSIFDRSDLGRLDRSVRAADLVHMHTLWNPINLATRRACLRHGRPYVLMPHGMLDPYSLSVRRWRKALYLWAIEGTNISSARRLIYTTVDEARLAATQVSSLPAGTVVPLGGDPPGVRASELAAIFINQFPKARNRRQLLFLGRIHFKKGIDRILMALPAIVRACPDVLLTVVGDGTSDFEAMLRRVIADQSLEDYVLMTGRLDGAAKWGAYASAELFLLPSRQENFAITVAEAMHMGLPLVISNKVNTWPYVRDAGAGIVLDEATIEPNLSASIMSLLQDKDGREMMGRRGQDYARLNLTWAQAGVHLMKCYEEIVGAAPVIGREF